MYLFFDGVSTQWYIGLYDLQKNCVAYENFAISGNESTQTIPVIDCFLKKQNIKYTDIENIAVVAGPWSFTGIRTISLVVNTLAYIYPHIYLTSINFFDLYQNFPAVKSSSKRDLFVKWKKSATIEIVQNGDFESSCERETIYGDVNIDRFETVFDLKSAIDYEEVFRNIALKQEKQIAPLYIKKPNIS